MGRQDITQHGGASSTIQRALNYATASSRIPRTSLYTAASGKEAGRSRRGTGIILDHPVNVPKVTSDYGKRRAPRTRGGRGSRDHRGNDYGYSANMEDPSVLAAADGKVVLAKSLGKMGNTIILLHENKGKWIATLYGHLDSFDSKIEVGATVKKGAKIGIIGDSGNVTAANLHFAVMENQGNNWVYVDPNKYLKEGAGKEKTQPLRSTTLTAALNRAKDNSSEDDTVPNVAVQKTRQRIANSSDSEIPFSKTITRTLIAFLTSVKKFFGNDEEGKTRSKDSKEDGNGNIKTEGEGIPNNRDLNITGGVGASSEDEDMPSPEFTAGFNLPKREKPKGKPNIPRIKGRTSRWSQSPLYR